MMKKCLSIFALIIALCALIPAGNAAERTEAADAATVYFIRQRAEPTAFKLAIHVDDKKVASLANSSHVVVKINPGSRLVGLKFPPLAAQKSVKNTLTFEPNATVYYLVAADFSNIRLIGGSWSSDRSMSVAQISQEDAEAIMSKLKH